MAVLIGTSGWQYQHWRGVFYPPQLAIGRWLDHYAARFATVEINNSFYQLPSHETFQRWASETPHDFVLCPKASRYLSHLKKLKDPAEPVARFVGAARGLGRKLGPVLLQLPGNFHANPGRLAETLACFGTDVRVAVELRHGSWFSDEVRGLLERHGAALCLADRGSRLVTPGWRTADWGYLRLHQGAASPHPCYGRTAVGSRARLLAETWGGDCDVYVFFNNDPRGCALRDARRFALACARQGLEPTRVPDRGDVEIAS
ncbi:MAG TPA: DUF72 domain-containing protein [Egibacteraceae bacterium]|nr:DUF72 domain-containing protein [Actinomycetota bacterium]HWB72788.1 DUF72 domain-containing protein [Egibacteraceae bacterium]